MGWDGGRCAVKPPSNSECTTGGAIGVLGRMQCSMGSYAAVGRQRWWARQMVVRCDEKWRRRWTGRREGQAQEKQSRSLNVAGIREGAGTICCYCYCKPCLVVASAILEFCGVCETRPGSNPTIQ